MTDEYWFTPNLWHDCGRHIDETSLAGRPCFGAIEMGAPYDRVTWGLLFPPMGEDKAYTYLCRFWAPVNPGDVIIDSAKIYDQIKQDAFAFNILQVGIDRWGDSYLYLRIEDMGLEYAMVGQGYAGLSGALKRLTSLLSIGQFRHGNDATLNKMTTHLVVFQSPEGYIKPNMRDSPVNVTGIVALLMALSLTIASPSLVA